MSPHVKVPHNFQFLKEGNPGNNIRIHPRRCARNGLAGGEGTFTFRVHWQEPAAGRLGLGLGRMAGGTGLRRAESRRRRYGDGSAPEPEV
jgi:hypothetical protein